jgi:uncharacterized protein HemY
MPSKIDDLLNTLSKSGMLDANDIELLRNTSLPSPNEIETFASEPEVSAILEHFSDQPNEQMSELIKLAKQYMDEGLPQEAWKVILQD